MERKLYCVGYESSDVTGGVLGMDAISLKVRNNSAAPPNKSARKWVIYARQS
ncbi:MAG: hypothetical protein LBJ67_17460 [Planctomycetaceae bacterium]|nr:hypothetical protein [Planctomycetaceae bacterium]